MVASDLKAVAMEAWRKDRGPLLTDLCCWPDYASWSAAPEFACLRWVERILLHFDAAVAFYRRPLRRRLPL